MATTRGPGRDDQEASRSIWHVAANVHAMPDAPSPVAKLLFDSFAGYKYRSASASQLVRNIVSRRGSNPPPPKRWLRFRWYC